MTLSDEQRPRWTLQGSEFSAFLQHLNESSTHSIALENRIFAESPSEESLAKSATEEPYRGSECGVYVLIPILPRIEWLHAPSGAASPASAPGSTSRECGREIQPNSSVSQFRLKVAYRILLFHVQIELLFGEAG
jgi:hypothetical protein